MASAREWADAYLAQARADLRAADALAAAGSGPSVLAMLLQMTFEKFAKSALLRGGQMVVAGARTHRAASRMILAMRRQRGLLDALGGPWPWMSVFGVVDALERAHPAVAASQGPKLAYPWEDVNGAIR